MPADFSFPGHTEYLAARAGTSQVLMMLAGPTLRVVPLTIHIPLGQVPEAMRGIDWVATALTAGRVLGDDLGISSPRLALVGLNPHAGENGRIGTEEEEILVPAIGAMRGAFCSAAIDATIEGPFAADGFFARQPVPFDLVLCCYHDQALIPVKLLHPNDVVNVSLGLPFVRTSPGHGSARDIAGKGVAHPGAMAAAIGLAVQMAERRRISCP